uniref:Secreted protein n=1 Tax=Panagrellus redivivus TaxID=6233 RepID=A0A7E4W8K8_PANRE
MPWTLACFGWQQLRHFIIGICYCIHSKKKHDGTVLGDTELLVPLDGHYLISTKTTTAASMDDGTVSPISVRIIKLRNGYCAVAQPHSRRFMRKSMLLFWMGRRDGQDSPQGRNEVMTGQLFFKNCFYCHCKLYFTNFTPL